MWEVKERFERKLEGSAFAFSKIAIILSCVFNNFAGKDR